jgi:Domain of unknown function (DUF4442)
MNPGTDRFFRFAKHPIKFRMFLFSKLPSAYFAGVRVREIDEQRCLVTVPYKWFSKNPFRSTYFACLSMAAEMSTGALALAFVYQRNPAISMLVVKMEADYFKKAVGLTSFVCNDGTLIEEAINKAIASGEGQTVRVISTGMNENGEMLAKFFFTWSFKAKKRIT